MRPVSAATAVTLREAMTRLLDGQPLHCDGALSIANLAREARVSRATANRDRHLVEAFRQAVAARTPPAHESPDAVREQVRQLQAELADRRDAERADITRLRTTVAVLAQHVQALALDNAALRQALDESGDVRTLPQP